MLKDRQRKVKYLFASSSICIYGVIWIVAGGRTSGTAGVSGRVPRESRPSTSGNLQFQPVARPAMGRATLCFLGPGGNSQFSVLPKQASRAGPEEDEGQAPRATFSFNRTSNGQRGNPSFSFTTTPSFTKASYSSVKASKSLKF